MRTNAATTNWPVVLISGVCFGVALVAQLLSAESGSFGYLGSASLIISFLCLATVSTGSLLRMWVRIPKSTETDASTNSKTGIICAVVATAATAVYAARWMQPTENIVGGYDEGIYAITAANLAQSGHYRLNAALLPSLPSGLESWTITKSPRMANRTATPPPSYPCYHTCLFVYDKTAGILVSQFPVGFPALLGSAHLLLGFTGQRYINPIVLFTSACLAGILLTSWAGILPGTAAFVLWLWFPLQTWGGNTHFAEVTLQLLWLLTLVGLADRTSRPPWSGLLVGLGLGISLAVKIDALPVLAITALTVTIATIRTERTFLGYFLIALLVSGSVSSFGLWQDNRAYLFDTLRSIAETNRQPFYYLAIFVAAGGIGLMAIHYFGRRTKALSSWIRLRPLVTGTVIFGMLVLAGYAYFVRSHPKIPDTFYYWPQKHAIRSYREDTFFRLGWYWHPWGLTISVIGIVALIRDIKHLWQGLAVAIGLLYLIAFGYDIRNNPIEPYALRRFLPYAIPLLIAGASAIAMLLPKTWSRYSSWLTVIITAGLMAGFWPINERLNQKTEYAGLVNQVERLAETIPERAVVLVSTYDPLARLASSLEFVYGRPTLIVRQQSPVNGKENPFLGAYDSWKGEGRLVYVLSSNNGETLHIPGVIAVPIDNGDIVTKAISPSEKSLITDQIPLEMRYYLNELRRTSGPPSPASPDHAP